MDGDKFYQQMKSDKRSERSKVADSQKERETRKKSQNAKASLKQRIKHSALESLWNKKVAYIKTLLSADHHI